MDKNVGEFSWSGFMLVVVGILIVIFREQIPLVSDLLWSGIKDFIGDFNFGASLTALKFFL